MGNPCLYKSEYDDELIEHLASGYSFESFAGRIGVTRATIYNWRKSQASFQAAFEIGLEKGRFLWEKRINFAAFGSYGTKNAIDEGVFDYNPTLMIFCMKNRFGWRDKVDLDHTIDKPKTDIDADIASKFVKPE